MRRFVKKFVALVVTVQLALQATVTVYYEAATRGFLHRIVNVGRNVEKFRLTLRQFNFGLETELGIMHTLNIP